MPIALPRKTFLTGVKMEDDAIFTSPFVVVRGIFKAVLKIVEIKCDA